MNRLDREADRFEEHPVRQTVKWGTISMITIAILVVVGGVIFGIVGLLGGWFQGTKHIVSFQNTSQQYTVVKGDWESMISAAQNACNAQNAAQNSNSPTLVEDPAFAYKATFFKIRNDYNRRMTNFFEAGLVGPRGYPKVIPSYPAFDNPKASWCRVATGMQQIHE